jgi:AcrR family transcriptional regulator
MIPKRMTTKEVILYVASDLFMEKGFAATSTREIAENAGITQPNLYHHFKTKEDIYIAVLEKLSSEVKTTLEAMVEESTDALFDRLIDILNYLRKQHPVNFSIMRHDMTYEISEENHYHLYQIFQDSYLAPVARLFSDYVTEESPFTARELSSYFYSMIAPFIQKDNRFYKVVTSEKIVYLFVYGILDKDEEEK